MIYSLPPVPPPPIKNSGYGYGQTKPSYRVGNLAQIGKISVIFPKNSRIRRLLPITRICATEIRLAFGFMHFAVFFFFWHLH